MTYEPVIGLEVHLQLSTKTKAFCGCSTLFGQRPNSQACPVCLGLPGALPKLNREAFLRSIKVALALSCSIQNIVKFDRKNYYYPDLPKNFQISQYDKPIAYNGFVKVGPGEGRKIRVKRVHLEEDAGKLIHETGGDYSLVDYNRSGMPLLEIVTEPDINSPDEAYEYLVRLKSILKYLDVSDCDMEKGSLRCDANISVRPEGTDKLGLKVELKNMNTFKGVKEALEYEASRQLGAVRDKEKLFQETRLWDAEKKATVSMRVKEEAHDYRYFPEPDLVPFVITESTIAAIREALPDLPEERAKRIRKKFSLSDYDTAALTADRKTADYFEECAGLYDNPKTLANWIMGEISSQMNLKKSGITELGVPPKNLVGLLELVDSGKISGKMAKEVFLGMVETKKGAGEIVSAAGMSQITDRPQLESVISGVLEKNKRSVEDYRAGKKSAFMHLVGQVMRETKGRANPELVNDMLKKSLGD